MTTYDMTLVKIRDLISRTDLSRNDILYHLCKLLKDNIKNYDWVGFYFADHNAKTLRLGTFAGKPTEHITIPFGKGICGQVADSNQPFLVPDVMAQDNYIACSVEVKSEIVVPLFVNNQNIGQIDVDSHVVNAFTGKDEGFLIAVNQLVAKLF